MYIEFSPEQQTLRQELREYYRRLFTPELRRALDEQWDQLGGPAFREAMGRMGKDGWLVLGWPEEYGGQGRGHLDQFIFWDETYRARAPLPVITVNTVGPMLMRWGSDAQKAELLPKIRDGELLVGIGYTEPSAGTDLAALQTRAVRDGDEWVINGQKVFTTHAQDSEYIWLAARTDPDAPKHKGISIILVPTDVPGFSCTPIRTIGGEMTNATYFENVRVPVENLVGPENGGWGLITGQLNLERITLAMPGPADRLLDEVWAWAEKTSAPDGGRLLDVPWVQQNLARVYAKLDALKVLNWRSAWAIDQGQPAMADASAVKVLGTEMLIELYRLLLEITQAGGTVRQFESGALFGGILEQAYRGAMVTTFGGGVNEVMRDIIAMAGLGLPRSRR
ncbi:MAG: acyl-CoA dehydrogenase family protein [Deltaproteobacteria bacterium]|nr:acyl-CoA dehydrogenase family protein [Deltaproteobacteria bacterium]